ncbi:unnamed protein product, partial [Mesorhabditis belari]|uniref:ShKT domain-containing protein n=1 Tax=Mesorhabditis belari TaxID=2138241 RepID=A0AAF3FG23_9BILA
MSISKNGTETEKNSKNSTGKARNLKSETSKVIVSNGLKNETKIAESPKNQTVVLEAPRNGIPLLERLDEKRYHFSPSLSPSVLEEILVTTDVLLPKISQNTPSEMTISLSKTIIRGTCFDRYIYCGEFRTLCTHPTFEFVMAQKCALTCDRCIEGNIGGEENLTNDTMCIDLSSECQDNVNLCEAPLYRETMHKLCPKSCKICTPFCKDRHDNCLTYKEEGFCENAIYTLKERQYLCGEMCGICGNHTENRAF